MNTRRPVIIDCDPGRDDAIALMMALNASDRLDVLAITAVAGNTSLDNTQRNARIVCEWVGATHVSVYAGCHRPLFRSPVHAHEIHGKEGMDGTTLHSPSMKLQSEHAADAIIRLLHAQQARVTLCALGPLTNIAFALTKAPEIASRIEEIVAMGGTIQAGGNVTPCAEFNIYADPHAAKIVMESGVAVTLIPLDVTHQVLLGGPHVARLKSGSSPAARKAAELLARAAPADQRRFGVHGTPMHDPCVIAYLLDPNLFHGRTVNVSVETSSALTLGTTVVDWWETSGRRPNVRVLAEVNAPHVVEMITELLLNN